MSSSDEKSPVKKLEQAVNDLGGIRARKPWLFWCIVAGLLLFCSLYVFEKLFGIPALKEQVAKLEKENQDVKRDRDSKATQLAPFLAVANREFKDAPEEKRLEMLIPRVERAIHSLETTAKNINAPRRLSDQQVVQMIAVLKSFTNYSCHVTTQNANYEVMGYARQLESIFRASGWNVQFQPAILPVSVQGVLLEFAAPAPIELAQALLPIWTSFGHRPTSRVQTNMAPTSLTLIVGEK